MGFLVFFFVCFCELWRTFFKSLRGWLTVFGGDSANFGKVRVWFCVLF